MNTNTNICECKTGFKDLDIDSYNYQICYANCDTYSSSFNSETNDCDCKSGFNGKDLDGSLKFCQITCDSDSTTKDSTLNTCPCKSGYITPSLSTSGSKHQCSANC